MTTDDHCPDTPVSIAYRVLRLLRAVVAILVGLATIAATLGWI